MRDGDFEGGRAFRPAPPVTDFSDLSKQPAERINVDEHGNVKILKEGFSQPLQGFNPEEEPVELGSPISMNNPNELRIGIINRAATEAREAYDHWVEAVSFLRIVEPGADKHYGTLTKGLLDAATYMEGKE